MVVDDGAGKTKNANQRKPVPNVGAVACLGPNAKHL